MGQVRSLHSCILYTWVKFPSSTPAYRTFGSSYKPPLLHIVHYSIHGSSFPPPLRHIVHLGQVASLHWRYVEPKICRAVAKGRTSCQALAHLIMSMYMFTKKYCKMFPPFLHVCTGSICLSCVLPTVQYIYSAYLLPPLVHMYPRLSCIYTVVVCPRVASYITHRVETLNIWRTHSFYSQGLFLICEHTRAYIFYFYFDISLNICCKLHFIQQMVLQS
jgi:hypothetical protein